VSRPTREELDEMREQGNSTALRDAFTASQRAIAAWEQSHPPPTLDDVLDWVDELRRVFGEPEVDRAPWVGTDFRL